ncbi:MAG: YceI family protein [Pedobacter sp.]|uniref:YceI family protein n=1 Tax=Pedobacter sp. TaxID=1411316 RepID=UPI002808BF64|nr:YceI family protein [Pedobacter sp.]MDQ8004568.1 YceI family protein [Pedobacter sp.]
MKLKITSILMLALVASFSFFAFKPKADVYTVDVTKSTINWEGKKFSGSHTGTVALTSGNLQFNGKKLVEGGFIADMTTVKTMDGDKPSPNLDKHLKNDDFFGVDKFPAANFVIKKVEGNGTDVKITGDLTIKGKTNSVSFPAKLTWNADKTVTAVAEKITIDRTKYGIEYKSKSIFSSIGDNFIYDDFTIAVKLVAKK